jgi:uncharacterized protein
VSLAPPADAAGAVQESARTGAPSIPAGTRPGPRGELLIVLIVTLALPLLLSAYTLIVSRRNGGRVLFGDTTVLLTLLYEVVIALALVPWLRRRGWTLASTTRPFESRDLVRGVGLFVLGLGAYYLTYNALLIAAPDFINSGSMRAEGRISILALMLAVIINSVFEEFLWLGYLVPAGARVSGLLSASLFSGGLRVLQHGYQGATAFTAILPVAVILTWYYARTGRVWPVVTAHAIQNTIAFGMLL